VAAFLIVGIGRARKLEGAVQRAFRSVYRLNGSTWMVRRPEPMTAKEVIEALGLRELADDAVVVCLHERSVHGVADPKVWRFIDGGLKSSGNTENEVRSSIYDA
jgi:hypothetical protein